MARRPTSLRTREAHFGDRVFHFALKVVAWSTIVLVAGIILLLARMAWPALTKFGLKFFTGDDWNPPMDVFGALPFIYGTLVTSFMALVLAAPVSIGVALFFDGDRTGVAGALDRISRRDARRHPVCRLRTLGHFHSFALHASPRRTCADFCARARNVVRESFGSRPHDCGLPLRAHH